MTSEQTANEEVFDISAPDQLERLLPLIHDMHYSLDEVQWSEDRRCLALSLSESWQNIGCAQVWLPKPLPHLPVHSRSAILEFHTVTSWEALDDDCPADISSLRYENGKITVTSAYPIKLSVMVERPMVKIRDYQESCTGWRR
ncbi:MAG: hypothetical protein HYV26_14330 [Candidatus Hydrogenedentes bacterium]|nr:hypothetical protein [Candidatus Hydrogenedentota bacterium]